MKEKLAGKKYDGGKAKLSLIFRQFPRAIEAIVRTSEYGNAKYENGGKDWENFKRVEDGEERYRDAGLRHEQKRAFHYIDPESGLPHLFHKAWNALAELEIHLLNKENGSDNIRE